MAANDKQLVLWFDVRKGMLTYSMYGSRNGTDGTADCSGSITQAIKDAGGSPYAYLYSTVTLEPYLKENGYERIAINQEWNAQVGDIVMMSWGKSMADSAGAGGHVGTMKNANDFISVDYWTGGQQGTAVSEHNIDDYLATNQPSYFEVWRLKTSSSSNNNNNNNNNNDNDNDNYNYNENKITETPNKPITEKDEEIMFKYIKVLNNGREEQWFAGQGKRMYLPTGAHIDNIDFLLKDLGKSTKATEYKEGSYALKAIEAMYTDSKTFK